MAQLYLTRPLLLEGRKSHLRLWLLVVSHPGPARGAHRSLDPPYRAYLHDRGLVLFSSETYRPSRPCVGAAGALAPGHVTNLARNSRYVCWSGEIYRSINIRADALARGRIPDLAHNSSLGRLQVCVEP